MRHFEQQHHQEQNTEYGHQRSWQEGTSNEAEYFGEPAAFGSKSKKPPNLNIFHQNQNRSIFVRDLPFHTTAQILREFIETVLEQPGAVEEAMVRYSQQGKTLQVACVLLRSETLVPSALEKLHGRIFFGRNLRVTVFNNKAPIEDSQNAAVQFSFLANDAQMPLVTEEVVRAHMEEMYGPLRDVCIRFHKYSESGIQSGYGFLTFTNESDNERAVDEVQKKVIHNLQYDCRWSSKCKPVSAPGTLRNKRLAHLAAATPTYGPEALATVQQNRQQSPVPRPNQPSSSSTSNNREEAPGLDTPPAPLQRYPSYQGNHHFQHHHTSRDATGMLADYRPHHRGAGRPPSPPPAYSYSRGGMFPEEQFPPHYQSSRYDPSPPYHRHNTSRDYLFDEVPHSRVPPPPDAYDPYYNDPELPPRERDTLLSYEDSFRGFDARPSAMQDFDLPLPYERSPAYRSHHHPHGQPRGYSLPTQLHPSYVGRSQVGGALSYDGYTTDSSRSRMFSSTSSAGHRGLHEAELHYLQQYRRDFTDDRRATHSLSSSMSSSAYRTSSTDYPLGFVNYPDDLTSTAASRTVSDASVHSRSPLMSALLQPKLHGLEEDPCAPSSAATSLSLGGLTPSYFDVPRSANQSIDSVLPPSSLHSNKAISPNNAFGISRSLDMPSSTASLDVPFVNAEEERSNNNSSLWSSFHVDVTNLLAPSSQSETSPTSAPSS